MKESILINEVSVIVMNIAFHLQNSPCPIYFQTSKPEVDYTTSRVDREDAGATWSVEQLVDLYAVIISIIYSSLDLWKAL